MAKLFHLNANTSGDAKEIVSKAPLANDGFDIAWVKVEFKEDSAANKAFGMPFLIKKSLNLEAYRDPMVSLLDIMLTHVIDSLWF